jgi:ubiquinone/menaquinone biosynthesis C-methylase UbiE
MPWRTRLQVLLIRWLNRFFAPPQFTLHTEEAARRSPADLQAEEFGRSRQGFLQLRESLSLRGGVALDLACGGGVKTASLAAAFPEARLVVGIDVDAAALQCGQSFSCQHGRAWVAFLRADAGAPPFKDQSIDLVVSENAFEHVPDPGRTLREVARALKDRGILSLRFFPMFFSRYGSHL